MCAAATARRYSGWMRSSNMDKMLAIIELESGESAVALKTVFVYDMRRVGVSLCTKTIMGVERNAQKAVLRHSF